MPKPFDALVIFACCLLTWETPAHGYIDPGGASYLFQMIAGAALAAVFVLRTYWLRIVTRFRSPSSHDSGLSSRP